MYVRSVGEEKSKTVFHAGIMTKIGYKCSPNFNIYMVAGAQYAKHKVLISAGLNPFKNPLTNEDCEIRMKGNFTKGKLHPVVGLGCRYDFANKFFVKLEYNYLFKSKVGNLSKFSGHIKFENLKNPQNKKDMNLKKFISLLGADSDAPRKYSCHIVKIGIGYVF